MPNLEIPPTEAIGSSPDALAIFTYSSNIDPVTGEVVPSALSRFVADVALAGWSGSDTTFVIAGERSFGLDYPSTGDLIEADFTQHGVSNKVHVIDSLPNHNALDNTGTQVEALADFQEGSAGSLWAVALGYHIPRIARYARSRNLDIKLVSADGLWKILDEKGEIKEADEARHQLVVDAIPTFARHEARVRRVSSFDRSGFFLNFGTKLHGPCLHDVDPQTGKAIISTTRKVKIPAN